MTDHVYELRQLLNKATNALRDAEDLTRLTSIWDQTGTADRIRSIYEQITEDLSNGRTSIPPLLERLRTSDATVSVLWDALRNTGVSDETIKQLLEERGL